MSADFPVRLLLVLYAAWTINWSARGAAALVQRDFSLDNYNRAAWFWFAVASILFQLAHWFGITPEWRWLLLIVMLVALFFANMGRNCG